jgi:hypothetical protein
MTFLTDMDRIIGMSPEMYLRNAKKYAKAHGYNPNLLIFSTNLKYKLNYDGVDFGSALHFDYLIYRNLEKVGLAHDNEAENHRTNYLKRSSAIKGNWQNNPKSKNNLSRRILWNS